MWRSRLPDWENLASQILHWYGFSPVVAVVLGEAVAVCESLPARVTLVGAVPGVRAQVHRDGAVLRETALADRALERFVRAQVSGEAGGLGEGLLADGALVRFFAVARVGPGERVAGGRS